VCLDGTSSPQDTRWFAELTNQQLRCGAHGSVAQLEATIRESINAHHANPKPFAWMKTADQFLESIARFVPTRVILLTANRCTLISEDRESLSRVPLNISVDCDIEYRRVL
jgi:hypothetical protein